MLFSGLTSHPSLLQASGLSPLLPTSPGSDVRVPQLRTAPATLDFLLATASSLQAAARRDPRTFSLLIEPAASLLEASRSPTLHAALLHSTSPPPRAAPEPPHAHPGTPAQLHHRTGMRSPRASADAPDTAVRSPEKLWRFSLDAVMPAASRLEAHSSVALEVDLDQALGMPSPASDSFACLSDRLPGGTRIAVPLPPPSAHPLPIPEQQESS